MTRWQADPSPPTLGYRRPRVDAPLVENAPQLLGVRTRAADSAVGTDKLREGVAEHNPIGETALVVQVDDFATPPIDGQRVTVRDVLKDHRMPQQLRSSLAVHVNIIPRLLVIAPKALERIKTPMQFAEATQVLELPWLGWTIVEEPFEVDFAREGQQHGSERGRDATTETRLNRADIARERGWLHP